MKKKAIAIALVLVVALGSVFAAKGSLFASKSVPSNKVGVQLGYGARFVSAKIPDAKTEGQTNNNGFYAAGTFEFGVSKNVALKLEGGVNTMGQRTSTYILNGTTVYSGKKATENTPVNFTLYAGVMYELPLNNDLSFNVGGGVDMLIGKVSSAEDADLNASIGFGLEAGLSFDVSKQVSIVAGGKFGWHFINTNDDVQDIINNDNLSVSVLSYKFFGGLTYSL